MKKIIFLVCVFGFFGEMLAQNPEPVGSFCGSIIGGAGRCYTRCNPNQVGSLYRGDINIVNCSEVYDTLNNVHYYLDKSESLGNRWKKVVNATDIKNFRLQNLEYTTSFFGQGQSITIDDTTDFVKIKPPSTFDNTSGLTQQVNLPVTAKTHIQVIVVTLNGLGQLDFLPPSGTTILTGATWVNLQTYDLLDIYFLKTGEWIIKKR